MRKSGGRLHIFIDGGRIEANDKIRALVALLLNPLDVYCGIETRCYATTANQITRHHPLLCSGLRATMEVLLEAVFVIWSAPRLYHSTDRLEFSSRRRRRNGKSQIWDSKIWSRVPTDSDPRKTALASASSIYKRQTRPLVREGAPQKQDRNFLTVINIWSWAPDGARHQDLLTDRQSQCDFDLSLVSGVSAVQCSAVQ
jgi:hypothetical protein